MNPVAAIKPNAIRAKAIASALVPMRLEPDGK
jgi:hypothetical protein